MLPLLATAKLLPWLKGRCGGGCALTAEMDILRRDRSCAATECRSALPSPAALDDFNSQANICAAIASCCPSLREDDRV